MQKPIDQCVKDHPRLRGEKLFVCLFACSAPGSPPLTRGKGIRRVIDAQPTGITPAYAGKSEFHLISFRYLRDHPRLRGEKIRRRMDFRMLVGSPPLTRGKVIFAVNLQIQVGITPAYAGKSRFIGRKNRWCWDHPRLRGEKEDLGAGDIASEGSPPLTRGKDCLRCSSDQSQRITPAYAGKSRRAIRKPIAP